MIIATVEAGHQIAPVAPTRVAEIPHRRGVTDRRRLRHGIHSRANCAPASLQATARNANRHCRKRHGPGARRACLQGPAFGVGRGTPACPGVDGQLRDRELRSTRGTMAPVKFAVALKTQQKFGPQRGCAAGRQWNTPGFGKMHASATDGGAMRWPRRDTPLQRHDAGDGPRAAERDEAQCRRAKYVGTACAAPIAPMPGSAQANAAEARHNHLRVAL